MRDPTNQALEAVAKLSPPAAVTAYSQLFNMALADWVAVLTIIYMALQITLLLRDRLVRRKRETDRITEASDGE